MTINPRDPHAEERRQARIQAYDDAMAAAHEAVDLDAPHLSAREIAGCGLCDDDGYRGTTVCDHVDHAGAAKRGMAAVRAALKGSGA